MFCERWVNSYNRYDAVSIFSTNLFVIKEHSRDGKTIEIWITDIHAILRYRSRWEIFTQYRRTERLWSLTCSEGLTMGFMRTISVAFCPLSTGDISKQIQPQILVWLFAHFGEEKVEFETFPGFLCSNVTPGEWFPVWNSELFYRLANQSHFRHETADLLSHTHFPFSVCQYGFGSIYRTQWVVVGYLNVMNCSVLCCARFGRRRSLIAYYAISGVGLILSQVIPEQAGE